MSFIKDILYYIKLFFGYTKIKLPLLFALTLFNSFLELVGISMLLPILNVSTNQSNKDVFSKFFLKLFNFFGIEYNLTNMLVIIVCIFLFKAIMVFSYKFFSRICVVSLKKDLQDTIINNMSNLDYKYYTTMRSGRFSSTIVKEVIGFGACFTVFTQMMANFFYSASYALSAATLRLDLMISLILIGTILSFLLKSMVKKSKTISGELSETYAFVNSSAFEMFHNFIYLKATATINNIAKYIKLKIEKIAQKEIKLGLINSFVGTLAEPFAIVCLAGLLYVEVVIRGSNFNEIVVVGVILYRIIGKVVTLQEQWQRFNSETGSIKIIENLIKNLSKNKEKSGLEKIDSIDGRINFENVNFYHGKTKIIDDLTLEIKPRELVGIVGSSGAGKTTIFNLLTGLYEPKEGKIKINEKDLSKLDKNHIRKKIGYVTQDPTILNDTIANNISFWQISKEDENYEQKIRQATKLAHCEDITKDLEKLLGENGVSLSGGQKQRIAIARELLKEPELLIFDEATSALDGKTDNAIRKSIKQMQGKMTMLIISHRLSTIKNCDIIYVLEKGKIVERGSFEELLAGDNPKFREMYEAQND